MNTASNTTISAIKGTNIREDLMSEIKHTNYDAQKADRIHARSSLRIAYKHNIKKQSPVRMTARNCIVLAGLIV